MLIIAVVVAVTIGITKAKLDNIVSYTYYNAYSTLRKISTEMLADWDPQDPEYKQALNINPAKFAFNIPDDYRFFSTFLTRRPFGIQLPTEKARAGSTVTLYGCPVSGKTAAGGRVNEESFIYYYIEAGGCYNSFTEQFHRKASYVKCGGKWHGADTYTLYNTNTCFYDCNTGNVDSQQCCGGGTCGRPTCCGSHSDLYDLSCGSKVLGSSTSGSGTYAAIHNTSLPANSKLVSSTLTSSKNLCKVVIECASGYEWKNKGTNAAGSPYGECVKKKSDPPSGACNKTCISGYTLDKAKCTCVKDKYTCWDGSKVDYSYQCPSKVTCWDGSYAHSYSECPACTNKPSVIPCGQSWNERTCKLIGSTKKCYSSGQVLDPNTCECYVTCWDGSRETYLSLCPSKVTCWDGSYAHNKSECPACTKSCSEGYELNTSSCECIKKQVTCWDGSKADSTSSCPGYVTCWNGNKAHNWSECPACPNKPACPASWDDKTCTGSAKTCPSGQHLNSSCGCVNDCPTDISPCNICSNETGIVSQNPAINRSCSDETYEWSEEQCKCIPSPRTLPRKGMNFCKLFERHANIMSGSSVCSGSVISNGTTDFSTKTPDITLRNGLRIYNMHSDAGAISMLANNTQGGVYDGVPNTNSYGYTVYVDIDGSKGDSQLWSDVYPFYITLSGKIIPAYDTSNPHQSGGDSVRHLQVSVENENYASGKRSIKWLAKSVPFKEGACISGYVGDATPYCKNGTSFTKAGECTTNYNSLCRVKQIQPVKFFF